MTAQDELLPWKRCPLCKTAMVTETTCSHSLCNAVYKKKDMADIRPEGLIAYQNKIKCHIEEISE